MSYHLSMTEWLKEGIELVDFKNRHIIKVATKQSCTHDYVLISNHRRKSDKGIFITRLNLQVI
jgi:hypothetical protein